MTDDEARAIRERLEKATPGPWEMCIADPFTGWDVLAKNGPLQVRPAKASGKTDADFIAHAPTDIARLLSSREADRKEIERLKAEVRILRCPHDGEMLVHPDGSAKCLACDGILPDCLPPTAIPEKGESK